MPEPLLEMKGISKSFGGNPVLSDVDLGALGIYRGLTLILTGGMPVADVTRGFGVLATGNLLGVVPVPLAILVAVSALVYSNLRPRPLAVRP